MKLSRWLVLLMLMSRIEAFLVPPLYQRADILAEETSLTLSLGVLSEDYDHLGGYILDKGGLLQLSGYYVLKQWRENNPAVVGYVGVQVVSEDWNTRFTLNPDSPIRAFPHGGLGLQLEFLERPSLAAQLSLEFPFLISLTLLGGLGSHKNGHDIVTLGIKTLAYYPTTVFVSIHPHPRFHLSVSGSFFAPGYLIYGRELHAGVGYTVLSK